MCLTTNKYMLWQYRVCQPAGTTLCVLPPSPSKEEEDSQMQWFPAFPVSPQYPSEVMTLRGLLKLSEAAWRTDRRLLSGKLLCSSWGVRNKAVPTQYATKRITTRQHQTMYPASVWFATAGTDMANFLHLIIVKDVSFQTKMLLFPGYPFADFLLRVGGLHQSPIFSCCIPFQYQVLQQKKKMWQNKSDLSEITWIFCV